MPVNEKFGKTKAVSIALLLALVLSFISPVANPSPSGFGLSYSKAQADAPEIGYLWKLYFDFDSNFSGLLTVEVGPWQNGELVSVTETSTTRIRCKPIGAVALGGGSANFAGGHLQCEMDLAKIVSKNHKLAIDPVDDYGSIVARTRILSNAPTLAPIFTHPNAAYSIDFTQTSSLTQNQLLWNGIGMMQGFFGIATLNTWQTHTMEYICISNGGPCDARYGVAGQTQAIPTAGSRAQFMTGPTSFQIGGAAFSGQMDALLIDPGNSAH